MVRINQGVPSPPQSSAGRSSAATAGTSLRSRLAAESDEDLLVIENPEKRAKRLRRHWDRLVGKVCLMMTTEIRKRVEQHWEDQALLTDQKLPEATQTAQPKKSSKPRRRDDLTGIGLPMPPTSKK